MLRFVALANMLRTSITPLDMKVSITEYTSLVIPSNGKEKKIINCL